MIHKLLMVLEVGAAAGLLFGGLISWGMMRTLRRADQSPSWAGRLMTVGLILLFTVVVIGPLFSFVYRHVFCRLFPTSGWLVFGLLNTMVLGVLMNLYAWQRRMKDLAVIVSLNAGGALILGWGIPLLFLLFR